MLLDVVHFTPMQKRIIGYRMEESRVKMADLEKVSVATIDREIKEIDAKIKKAYDNNLIVFCKFFDRKLTAKNRISIIQNNT